MELQHRGRGADGAAQHRLRTARSEHGDRARDPGRVAGHHGQVARAHGAARHRRALGAASPRRSRACTCRRWPVADPDLVVESEVTMVVQVNGKVRARLAVSPSISEDEATRRRSGRAGRRRGLGRRHTDARRGPPPASGEHQSSDGRRQVVVERDARHDRAASASIDPRWRSAPRRDARRRATRTGRGAASWCRSPRGSAVVNDETSSTNWSSGC